MSLQNWLQQFMVRAFGVHVNRKPPFGTDSLAEVRRLRRWAPGDVIFDVGANDGRTVVKLQRYFPSPQIFSFEPVADTFQVLTSRTAEMANVRRFQVALGAEAGEQTIYTGGTSTLNSFSADGWQPAGKETVRVSTVDHFMTEHGIGSVAFLKVDTEGHDLNVLHGAEKALSAGRIDIVQVETGFHQQSRSVAGLEEIRSHLAARGYSLFGIFNQCRTPARPRAQDGAGDPLPSHVPNVLAYCDAVFASNALLLQKYRETADGTRGR